LEKEKSRQRLITPAKAWCAEAGHHCKPTCFENPYFRLLAALTTAARRLSPGVQEPA